MERVYLDHAATTPVDPEVAEAMSRVLHDTHGNPSSIYAEGRAARAAVDRARDEVAAAINAEPAEIVFTSGGTEADNLALRGALKARGDERDRASRGDRHRARSRALRACSRRCRRSRPPWCRRSRSDPRCHQRAHV